ncbi:protocadherin Fat 3-like [Anopheles stephensi]|uniref:protocadherin Fat 3-like n=1 Tax=Anopheles stephensi TaxID=30069 RepID=UPI0016588E8F|nr:protocadherin Fat 3-like [Anopheles stephensi]
MGRGSECAFSRLPLIVILALMLVPATVHAQECSSPTLSFGGQFPVGPEISATVGAGYTLAQHDVTNVASVSVSATASNLPVYIEAVLDAGRLTIRTSAQFVNYEKQEDTLFFLQEIRFTCASGSLRDMTFRQSIKEENNHAPLFSQAIYNIAVPLPLPREFNIQQFIDGGKGIVAHDYDITKNKVSFSIAENDYFTVQTANGSSRTQFLASLITKQTLTKIQPPITLQITAVDEGSPPKSSQATLNIEGDPVISFVPPPEFEQNLYRTAYKIGATFTPVRISMAPGTYDSTVSFETSGDDADYFTVTPAADRSSVTVSLRSAATIDEGKKLLTLTIAASRSGTDSIGRTALVVELSTDPKVVPTFEASLYTGTIDRNKVISVDSIKLIPSTSDSSVRVQLTGEDAQYFTASLASNQVTVAPASQLTDVVLKEKHYFLVTVQADKADSGTGETLLVLSVDKSDLKDPRFEKMVYEGTITESGTLNVPVVRISPDSFVSGLEYSFSGDISLLTTNADSSGTITIAPNNVTPDKLLDKSYLMLSIVAKLEGDEVAHAVLILKVLRTPVVLPQFTRPLLEGEMIEKTLAISLPYVEIVPESFTADIALSVVDERYFFDIQPFNPQNVFKVFLRGNVTRGMLQGLDRLTFTVKATNPSSASVYCFVAIDIVRTAAPTFERLIYDGVIDESKQLAEEIVARLTADSTDASVVYTLEGEDASLFGLEALQPDGVRIKLKTELTEDEFDRRDHFSLNLKATNPQLPASTIVPVIVYVKHSLIKIPRFEKPLYKSRIDVDLQLVPFEQIELEPGTYTDSTTVAVRNSNSDLFEVRLSQGVVSIQLLKELDAAAVSDISRFEFVVECSTPGQASGFTTVIVDIDRALAPAFTDLFYVGEVKEDAKQIMFSQTVTLSPETIASNTEYSLEGYDSTLVRYEKLDDQSLSFFLRDEVSKDQLKLRSEIGFLIVATNPAASRSATVSCSVKIVREVKPTFTRTSFHGKIVEGTTAADFGDAAIAWEGGSVKETTSFTIVDAMSNNWFDVKLAENGSTVDIVLKPEVKWDQVRSYVYYQLILQAVNPGSDATQCTLVIDVENLPAITPTFTKSIYRGALQEGTKEVMFSAADTITVRSDTIMSTFQYAAVEGDTSLFDVALVEDNKFKVSLKDTVAPSDIEGRDLFSFMLKINNAYSADDTATIVITVKLDDIVNPTFGKLLYSGTIVQGTVEVSLPETIQLTAGSFTENTEIGVGGTDAALFSISRAGSTIELKVREGAINWDELASKHYLSVYVQATNPGSETSTSFVVIEITQLRQPRFAQSSAHGYIAAGERDVQFLAGSELRIVSGSTEPGYQWNLAGDDYQLFDGALVDDLFRFSLREAASEEQLQSRTSFKFRVTVKNPTGKETESAVVINRQLLMPQFSKHIYTGAFSEDLQLSLTDAIELTQASFSTGVLVRAIESNVDFLSLEQNGPSVQLKLSRPISTNDFQGLDAVRLVLEAAASDDVRSTCTVTLMVPEGTPCTPLPPIVDCSSCYNCTTGGVQEDVPVFANGNYRFQLRSDTTGPIGAVSATVKDPTAVVEHTIEMADGYLQSLLSITPEGLLTIARPLIPNVYQFVVHATNAAAGKKATANVWLDVLNQHECTEGDKQPTVDQVLVVRHLEEERPYTTIFYTQLSPRCSYELISEQPTEDDQQSYFYIDQQTNWLACRSFDREDRDLFGDMQVPQFSLLMQLKCSETDEQSQRSPVKRSLVETDTINYASDITIVTIIVDDINDNDPVFVEPATAPGTNAIHLGFPEPSLASKLMLSGLLTVRATDADEGLNAAIRYSLSENEHFMLDPVTGSIEPTKSALRDSDLIDLTVIATDREGALDGRGTALDLVVHRLHENHVAFLTVTTVNEASVQIIIDQINLQSDFHLKVLRQAYIPEADTTAPVRVTRNAVAREIEDSTSNMRLIVYALNDDNQLLNTDDIRNAIRNVFPGIGTSAIASFNDAVCYGNSTNPSCPSTPSCPEELTGRSSNGGLIASTSVLGGLLLITLALTMVLYLRYVRPLSKGADSTPSDVEQLENDFDSTPPPTPPTLGGKKEQPIADPEVMEDRKISINIAGITMQESEDTNTDSNRLARSLAERLDEEDEYGAAVFGTTSQDTFSEPKNVKFNEVVERIEVQEHHSDEEDGGSVYEERL